MRAWLDLFKAAPFLWWMLAKKTAESWLAASCVMAWLTASTLLAINSIREKHAPFQVGRGGNVVPRDELVESWQNGLTAFLVLNGIVFGGALLIGQVLRFCEWLRYRKDYRSYLKQILANTDNSTGDDND